MKQERCMFNCHVELIQQHLKTTGSLAPVSEVQGDRAACKGSRQESIQTHQTRLLRLAIKPLKGEEGANHNAQRECWDTSEE